MRSSCSRMRVKGAGRNAGSRRCSTALRPSPDATAQATASNGPSQAATRSTSGLRAAAAMRQLLPGLQGVAERKTGETSGSEHRPQCGRPGSRGWPPRECRSPSARAVPIPAGRDASSKRRRCAAETEFRARSAYFTTMRMRSFAREKFFSTLTFIEPTSPRC